MDYKKWYEAALNSAKDLWESGNDLTREQMELVFPELRESEDERIRKHIIALVEAFGQGTHKNNMLAWLEKQKEQKPAQDEIEREYVRTLKSLISDFLRGKEEVDREYYQKIYDWLDRRHIEQKPAEWSEGDEKMLVGIIERGSAQIPSSEPALRGEQMEWLMNRLKSLRPQPHWKPSEEQMNVLQKSFKCCYKTGEHDVAGHVLESLYNDLKNL